MQASRYFFSAPTMLCDRQDGDQAREILILSLPEVILYLTFGFPA